jgi:hypothetical protein
MPFKVRCRLVEFKGEPDRFPCHFDYKIGDEFTYDGEKFEGKICTGLFKNMAPVIWNTYFYGPGDYDRMIFLYSGYSARDPGMKKYDGLGFRPLKDVPGVTASGSPKGMPSNLPAGLIQRTRGFTCDDTKTLAYFTCEPIGLADGADTITYYNRQMNILEKIKSDPGMTVSEILNKFTKWEREEIYPPLYELNVSLMLDEMAVVNYIELRDGKAYPKNLPA